MRNWKWGEGRKSCSYLINITYHEFLSCIVNIFRLEIGASLYHVPRICSVLQFPTRHSRSSVLLPVGPDLPLHSPYVLQRFSFRHGNIPVADASFARRHLAVRNCARSMTNSQVVLTTDYTGLPPAFIKRIDTCKHRVYNVWRITEWSCAKEQWYHVYVALNIPRPKSCNLLVTGCWEMHDYVPICRDICISATLLLIIDAGMYPFLRTFGSLHQYAVYSDPYLRLIDYLSTVSTVLVSTDPTNTKPNLLLRTGIRQDFVGVPVSTNTMSLVKVQPYALYLWSKITLDPCSR